MKISQLAAAACMSALALAGCQQQSDEMGLDPAPTAARSTAVATTPAPARSSAAPSAAATEEKPAVTVTVENSEPPVADDAHTPEPTVAATGVEAPQPVREPTVQQSGAAKVAVGPGYTLVIPGGYEAVASEEWADLTLASGTSNLYATHFASAGDLATDVNADAAGWADKYGGTVTLLPSAPQVGGVAAAGYRVRLDDGYTIVAYLAQRGGQTYGVYIDAVDGDIDAHVPHLDAVARSVTFG